MSKLRHKAGLPRRPPLSHIWEELSKTERERLMIFAMVYIDKDIHMGSLPFISVGRFYDKLPFTSDYMEIRASLKWAISNYRRKHLEKQREETAV